MRVATVLGEFTKPVHQSKFTKCYFRMSFVNSFRKRFFDCIAVLLGNTAAAKQATISY